MEPITNALNSNGVLAVSGAHTWDQLTGVGVGFTIMFLVTVFSVSVSFYLLKQLLTIAKEGITTMAELKGAIRDVLDKQD